MILKYQYQKAIDYIEQQNDSSKEVMMQKFFCYNQLNHYNKALETLYALSTRFPDDIYLKTQLALCYNNNSMPDKSIEQFDELIKMDSSNTYFKIQKADLLYKLNLLDSAKWYYTNVWATNPNDFDTALKFIKININQKNYQTALQDLETLIIKDSVNLQANILTAYCFYLLENYDEAIVHFNKCQMLGDTSLLLTKNLGLSYYYIDDYTNSILYLTKAFAKDTTNNNILFALATANKEVKNYPESLRLYNKLTERMQPYRKAMYIYYKKLAETHNDNGNYMEAIENFKSALNYAVLSQNIELLFNISDIYAVYLNDYSSSLEYYNRYRQSLTDYHQTLTEQDSIENNDLQRKIANLDEHIKYIKYQIKKQKATPK